MPVDVRLKGRIFVKISAVRGKILLDDANRVEDVP
jgi:hypothetical protein